MLYVPHHIARQFPRAGASMFEVPSERHVTEDNILDARYSRNTKIVRTLNRYINAPCWCTRFTCVPC